MFLIQQFRIGAGEYFLPAQPVAHDQYDSSRLHLPVRGGNGKVNSAGGQA